MANEKERLTPEELPLNLKSEIGEIKAIQEFVPGVCYLTAQKENCGVNRQKGVPFFATRDGPICATCGIPLSISIPFIWVSRNCGQKLPEVWQSIGLSDLITILRLRRHLSRMAMPLAKSLTDAV